jgi:hypothetical protein
MGKLELFNQGLKPRHGLTSLKAKLSDFVFRGYLVVMSMHDS